MRHLLSLSHRVQRWRKGKVWGVVNTVKDTFHSVFPFPSEKVIVLCLVKVLELEVSFDLEMFFECIVQSDGAGK